MTLSREELRQRRLQALGQGGGDEKDTKTEAAQDQDEDISQSKPSSKKRPRTGSPSPATRPTSQAFAEMMFDFSDEYYVEDANEMDTAIVESLRLALVDLVHRHGGSMATDDDVFDVTHLLCPNEAIVQAQVTMQKKAKSGIVALSQQAVASIVGEDVAEFPESALSARTSPPVPSAPAVPIPSNNSSKKPLAGMVFCLTGTMSHVRAHIEAQLRKHGAGVERSVKAGVVTHLLCNDVTSGTTKVKAAQKLNLAIVDEGWLETLLQKSGGGSSAAAPASSQHQQADDNDDSPLADGESRLVLPGGKYTIKRIGSTYHCTCPAWKFQNKSAQARTCKHITAMLGGAVPAAFTDRCSNSSAVVNSASTSGNSLFDVQRGVMLAHKFDMDKDDPGNNEYWWSEKLDGVRAIWTGSQLVSRTGNAFDAPDFFVDGLPTDVVLDGELFAGRGQFQNAVSIVRRMGGGNSWQSLQYVVFDAPSYTGGFEARLAAAEAAVQQCQHAVLHPHELCRGKDHLLEELERVQKLQGEGLMLRRLASPYSATRSRDLLKVKTFLDDEAIVTGHQAGKGRHQGRMGALECKLRNGTAFKVGSGFSDAEREDPPEVGAVITFRYFEATKAGVPRFPTYLRLRQDVDPSDFD